MPLAKVPPQLTNAPFLTSTAAEYGVTKSALEGPEWRHVLHGVWAHVSVPDTRQVRLAAVRLVLLSQAFMCGLTAAWLWGIEVQDRRSDLVWVGHPTGHRPKNRPGVLVREITVDQSDIVTLGDMPITTILRTVFDCARWLTLVEAVVIADFFAHTKCITAAELSSYLKSHRGLRGCKQVAAVIDLMNPLTESPMETRLRLLLVRAGLGWLEAQVEIRDALGAFIGRADFAYVAQKVVVEYDGADHFGQQMRDEQRRAAMRRAGWVVMVVGSEQYYDYPDQIVARLREELRLRGWNPAALPPSREPSLPQL